MNFGERGSAAVEMVLVTPVLVCLLLLVVVGGRLATARNDVDYATRAGARAASIARSASAADSNARSMIQSSLNDQHFDCATLGVDVDTSQFQPGGQVTVTVDCEVDLSTASLLDVPMTRSVMSTFTEPIDTYVGLAQ
jgi:Flp pilus assembly protein TadG